MRKHVTLNAGQRADNLALEVFSRCKHWQGKSITGQAMRSIIRGALKSLRYKIEPLNDQQRGKL